MAIPIAFVPIKLSPLTGRILLVLFIAPIIIYNIARIIDPVRVRRWEASRWWHFRPGTKVPEDLDGDLLATSRYRRIRDRINAIIVLTFIVFLFASLKYLR